MSTGKEIKRLRLKARLSAEKAAQAMGIDADRLRKWEAKDLEPRAEDAKKLVDFFGCELEQLHDLESFNFFQKVPENELNEPTPRYKRTPKTEVDPEKEGITFIPISAQAGYARRINEPIFRKSLEKLYIPGMPYRGENFRIWEVEGNSMDPTFKEGFHVLTERVELAQSEAENWKRVKDYYAYVIVTDDDVLVKRIKKSVKTENMWVLISDNHELYEPFLFPVNEVRQLWLIKRKLDWEMSPPKRFEIDL